MDFLLVNHTFTGNSHAIHFSNLDRDLLDTISVKLQEFYNATVKKSKEGTFYVDCPKTISHFMIIESQILHWFNEAGFELKHLGTSQFHNFLIFERKG
ncbi:hypothetical protein M0811_11829 [Anaeramoeba ignava]|uniref:Uncharacterized protein n=1 Tax=Anaeramoeba ignava TaxID=1746090 RepID=A0A9Q0LAP2_ANAIG|nr:hypothetical protein M0811_11829 [Anaeramoeba ignava]